MTKEKLDRILLIQLIVVIIVVLIVLVVAVTLLIELFTSPTISRLKDAHGHSDISNYSASY